MAFTSPYVEVADRRTVVTNVIRALAVIAAAFVLAGILGQVGLTLLGAESSDALRANAPLYAALNALTFVGFFAAATGFLALRQEWSLVNGRWPTASDIGWALLGLLGVLVGAMVMGVVVQLLSALVEALFGATVTPGQNSIITQGRENPRLFLYMIPVALFFVGPAEELLFRGVVQGLLRQSFGVVPGLFGASALFGVGHYLAISSGSAWTYLLVAGALGLVLGAVYEYTENIVVPAITHGLWNAGIFVVNYYIAVAGVELPV